MGKKRNREKRAKRQERFFASVEPVEDEIEKGMQNRDVKKRSKLNKKLRKKLLRKEEQEQREKKRNPVVNERCGFHKVTVFVKEDVKIDKTFLLTSIGNYVDVPFCPLGYFRGSESITFYFDSNNEIAEAIQALNKRIPSPSGDLMGIKVTFVEETDFILNCDQVEILKGVMAQRFASPTGLLDLSAFHFDPQFLETNTFVPLFNGRILKQVLVIIRDHMSNVSAINLSNNKLSSSNIKLFEELDLRCPSLFALNLENNNIKHIHCLRYLRNLPLKEVKLVGNQFNKDWRSSSPKYIKAVRKELPFLKVLDGQDLATIKMEPEMLNSDSSVNLHPSPLATQVAATAIPQTPEAAVAEDKLKTFLEQYYALLDSPEKASLSQAYIPTAKIELKSENSLVPSSSINGQAEIAAFLLSWPVTKHDHASFNLEILSMSPAEGITKVSGVCLFQEANITLQFRRTMKIVPFNNGFCCAEDLLEIL